MLGFMGFAPMDIALDLHIILTLFFCIIACFWAELMPLDLAFICAAVMYIFVGMLTPTTASPAAHDGIIIEPELIESARTGAAVEARATANAVTRSLRTRTPFEGAS